MTPFAKITAVLQGMSPEQINVAIAGLLGTSNLFVLKKRGFYYRPNAKGYTACICSAWVLTKEEAQEHVYPYDEPVTTHKAPLPNYCADLNACADMRKSLSDKERGLWLAVASCRMNLSGWGLVDMTAPQHCELYLRVKGLWVEGGAKS